jgi:hypothetical protein
MNLKARLKRLEAARSRVTYNYTIIRRIIPDGWAIVTEIRDGRVVSRREVTAEEAARLSEGTITIKRSYGAERSAG